MFPELFQPSSLEEAQLGQWEEEDLFNKTIAKNKEAGGKHFVFQEGPPTANGLPGLHHVLARSFKDLVCRWKTMEGYVVERKAGWDCHGLPVEREVEKLLGLHTLAEVEAFGASKFNDLCEESVWGFEGEWEKLTKRMGFWLDMKKRYATLDQEYMESEWWALKQLWDKGLLRRGYKVLPYSPKTGCTYSNRDVSEGYRQVTDLTCFVRFPLSKNQDLGVRWEMASMLVWTSTPWTLPGNVLLAVNKSLPYVSVMLVETKAKENKEDSSKVEKFQLNQEYFRNGEVLVLAKARLCELQSHLLPNSCYTVEILKELNGSDLLGFSYEPPLCGSYSPKLHQSNGLWQVVHGDFVNDSSGTGVVHVAPMYGEDDHKLCVQQGLDFTLPYCQHVVGLDGCYHVEGRNNDGHHVPPKTLQGLDVTCEQTQKVVLQVLFEQNMLYRAQALSHDYPFCWRNKSHRLLYYAMDSWFVAMGTPAVRSRMLALNASKEVTFYPESVKHGRFGSWLKETKDWCLSRKRTWGCPLPVWECKKENGGCGKLHCVGSRDHLKSLLVNANSTELDTVDLHSTQVDALLLKCVACGNEKGSMCREKYVLDCWFDSGCAPFAQWHYPFAFEKGSPPRYNGSADGPVDFVAEGQDQCRGWFYSLLCLSTTLFDRPAYKKCLSLGLLLDKNGHKMSKSKGNGVDPWKHFNEEGSDALRWYLVGMCAPWADRRFDETKVRTANQKFFRMFYNVAKWWNARWFELNELIDDKHDKLGEAGGAGLLDEWVLSRLAFLVKNCNSNFSSHNFHLAVGDLEDFLNDDLSKTYLRLSRVHFQRKKEGPDLGLLVSRKNCLCTLRSVLLVLCRLVAPVAPFFVDRLHRCLLATMDSDTASDNYHHSVHLAPWPCYVDYEHFRNEKAEAQVRLLRHFMQAGNTLHDQGTRPGRLPLSRAYCTTYCQGSVAGRHGAFASLLTKDVANLLAFELNVMEIVVLKSQLEFESVLCTAQTTSLTPNKYRLRVRFKEKTNDVLRGLYKHMGQEYVLHDDSLDMLEQEDLEKKDAGKSKKQMKREKKKEARRRKKEDKYNGLPLMTGPHAEEAIMELESRGSFWVESGAAKYELMASDFLVSRVTSPSFMVSTHEFVDDFFSQDTGASADPPRLETGLVLDLSVESTDQVSAYLFKEVMHFVQMMRKSLETKLLRASDRRLRQVALQVVVKAQPLSGSEMNEACLSVWHWELLLQETQSNGAVSSLKQDPNDELMEKCMGNVADGEMEKLVVKGFGCCPYFDVYVMCKQCHLDDVV